MHPKDLDPGCSCAPTRCLTKLGQERHPQKIDWNNKEPTSASPRLWLSALIGRGQGVRATLHSVLVLLLLSGAMAWSSEALATATINKQFTSATVDPGDISRFRITVGNSSLVPLTAAAVTDNLPANIKIANPINAANTCGFTGVTATPGTSQIVLTGGTVPAASGTDGLCYFELDVVSTVVGNWINTIPKNGPTNGFIPGGSVSGFQALEGGATITNTTDAVATLSVRGLSPPTGTKTYSPTAGLVGQPFTINIVLANPNPNSTLPLTSFTDTLPTGMVVATPPDATVNCTGTGAANGTFAPNAGASAMTLTGGTIGVGGTCTLTAKAVVSAITGTSQSFNNQIPANAIGNARGLTSAAFSKSITVSSPVTVTKSFSPTTLRAGQTGSLSIVINNSATATVGLLIDKFTDNLPAGLVVAASGTKTVTCTTGTPGTLTALAGSGTVTLAGAATGIGSTTANRRCTIVVPVTAAAAGSYVNSTAATGPDTVITNSLVSPSPLPVPVASATLTVNSQLTVAKTVSDNTVAPGETTIFTVTISNWSTGALGGVAFTDNLPLVTGNQMTVAAPGPSRSAGCTGGTFSGAAGAAAVTWTGGTVAAGSGGNAGTCTISIPVTLPASAVNGAVFTNAIPVGAITGNGGISNTNSVAVNVTAIGAVSVSKAFSPASVAQGQPSTLTVTLANGTASPIAGVALTDTLPISPGPVVVAPTPNASTTCAGGSLSAFPGTGSVGIAGATVPANGSCTFSVNVVGNTVGAHTNTIPAEALTSNVGATNPTEASANLTVTSGLTGTKTFSPTAVAKGGVSRVTIQVNNPTPAALTNVSITDPLPTGTTALTVANPANATTTCSGSPVIAAVPGAAVASLTGATVPVGGNCLFLFDVVAGGSANTGNWTNTIPVGNIASAEGIKNIASISATLTRNTTTRIGINKSFDPIFVTGGQPSVLRIDVTNPVGSPSGANNVTFTDNLPVGIEVYAVPNTSTTCANGVVTAAPGGTSVRLSGATLPANSTCSVYVTTTSTKFLNLINTIPASAVTATQGYTNSLATTATLATLQGLGAAKSFSPTSITVGQTARLAIRLTSTLDPLSTTPTLTGVSFTDSLPSGLTVAPTPNASTDCNNGTLTAVSGAGSLTLSGATIGAGSSCFVYVDVTASALGVYTNVIPKDTATSNEGFRNSFDGIASLNVLDPPVIAKAFSPAQVKAGQVSTLTVTIANANAQSLSAAALTDNLPTGLTVADPANASTDCSGGSVAAPVAGTSIALTNGTIPASGSCTFRADVVTNTPGAYPNFIAANALVTTEGGTNTAPATRTLTVLQPPTLAKSFVPGTVVVGEPSLLTITLGNSNASSIALLTDLIDTLPGVLKVASPNGLAGTCTLGSVTAVSGTNTIVYASGASIPTGGCTIQVAVAGAQAGSNQNLIPASGLVTDAGPNQTPATATLDVQAVSLGSTVFGDSNDNGVQDGAETGLSGVAVQLYRSTQTPGADTPVATDTTDSNGDYYFGDLQPGSYVVYIPTPPAGAPSSSSVTVAVDNSQDGDDNGIQSASGRPVASPAIALAVDGETTTEPGQGGTQDDADDNNGDMTVDFGFYSPAATYVAIGNRVWLDNGAGGGVANNGKLDGAEAGIDGVTVELHTGVGTLAGTATTAGGGYWFFDNLVPGDYYVSLAAGAFATGQPLAGLVSSTGAGSDETSDQEVDENGIDNANPVVNGIRSNTFALSIGGEQTGEDQTGYSGALPDGNVNATNDFGIFYRYDLALRKTVLSLSNEPLVPGVSTVTFAIEVFNQGALPATGIEVIDYVPTGLAYDPTLNTAALTGNANDWGTGPNPTLTIPGPIPAGGSATAKIVLKVQTGTVGQTLTNLAEILESDGGAYTDADSLPDGKSDNDNLGDDTIVNTSGDEDDHDGAAVEVQVFDLALKKTLVGASETPAIPGTSKVTFAIEVINQGDVAATDVKVVDYVPAGFAFVAGDNTGWSDTGNGPERAIASIAAGGSETLNIVLRLAAGSYGQTLRNAAEIGDDGEPAGADRDSTPDTDDLENPVKDDVVNEDAKGNPGVADEDDHDVATFGVGNFDLALRKRLGTKSSDPLIPGASSVTFTIEVINQGGLPASNVQVVDYVQAGLGFDAAKNTAVLTGNPTAWTLVGGKPRTTIPGPIPAGGSVALNIVLDVQAGTAGRTLVNLAEIAADGEPAGADADSTPDDTDGENPVKDDTIDEDGLNVPGADEDDHDRAEVKVEDRVALGNVVFLDNDNDGRFEPGSGEIGVNGVTVALYAQGADPSLTQPLATAITAGGGFYVFDLLPAGRYFVHIPNTQFLPGHPLEQRASSTGAGADTGTDDAADENGLDVGDPLTRGVSSAVVDLAPGAETVNETGQGTYGGTLPNASVDMTVDFGFKEQKALSCSVICDVLAPLGTVDNADIVQITKWRNRVVNPPGAANSGDCLPDGRITGDDAAVCRAYRN
jgi:uncharacterized repeat protein (TIGR01451 family)